VAGLVDGPPVEEVFANITIFIFLDLIIFLILFSFPDIVTWLPERIY
jgi:TRAP-type C4-dicarboxylate transport system permease large subunit